MFSYYLLITVLIIISFTWSATVYSAAFDAIKEYFLCEGQGYNPNRPCAKNHRKYNFDILIVITLAILALFPIYVLIVVVSVKDLKKFIQKYKFPSTEQTSK